jgi:hypothetical protein
VAPTIVKAGVRRAGAIGAAMLAGTAGPGCGTTSLTTARDERAEFDRYGSYFISSGPVVTDQAVTAVPDELVQDRIDAELAQELAAKGLHPAHPWTADLIITYTARAEDKQELVDDGFGPEVWPVNNTNVWVQNYREAVLVIDARDAETRKSVWRTTTRTKNQDFHDPEFVANVVNEAMQRFPAGER